MEYLHRFTAQIRNRILVILLLNNVVVLVNWYVCEKLLDLEGIVLLLAMIIVPILVMALTTRLATRDLVQPTEIISESILHVAPGATSDIPAPDPTTAKLGKELVVNLVHQVYELATLAAQNETVGRQTSFGKDAIATLLPLPLILLDPEQTIIFANEAASKYVGLTELVGKDIYSVLDMLFPTEETFDSWLQASKQKSVTATQSWERVRLEPADGRPLRLFDLAAYYNKDNPEKIETMLVLFDHTKAYSQDDQAISFIALSVHELRTPLTLLRGYIEAFEDEFAGKLDPEMNDFMFKMSATAQQLTSFVNNILNVARIDDDQLVLQLHEEDWGTIIRAAANNLALRAKVRGITLQYSVAPNLPKVGVDRVSILEVINNLVDNAIKYSGKSTTIRIAAFMNAEGLVETDVQDFGVGIPPNIIGNLFTKFYRDHHNRAQIGGTGLGLYLSKSIVTAHGGTVGIKSKLGEGSVFSFTLLPFSQMAEEKKQSANNEITRGAHGWIKNHSLYRR